MKTNTQKTIYSKVDYDGLDYRPNVTLRVWFIETDEAGNEIDRGCRTLTQKTHAYKTEKGAYKALYGLESEAIRAGNSLFKSAEWSFPNKSDADKFAGRLA